MKRHPSVYIVLVNWNGWQDTIECLESLFQMDYPNFRVIVCDNASQNESMNHIREWAEGRMASTDKICSLPDISNYSKDKPIAYANLEAKDLHSPTNVCGTSNESLVLIQTGANLGFAGGNNVGIRYALSHEACDFVWLLNNDTIVEKNSLRLLVEYSSSDSSIGICGASILYYDDRDLVQYCGGGTYEKWMGFPRCVGQFLPRSSLPETGTAIEQKLDYIAGSCMLVRREFIEYAGLMCEEYFLYFEELDWALRGRRRFRLGYEPRSVIYHKEGASTGSKSILKSGSSLVNDRYFFRNKLLFAHKFYPETVPAIYASFILVIFNRLWRGQFDRVRLLLGILSLDMKITFADQGRKQKAEAISGKFDRLPSRKLRKGRPNHGKPLISVVTVVFNAASCLPRAIQSIARQTYDNIEYMIIDGGSTDGTIDIIRDADHIVDYWISEPDRGIYHAMNKGLAAARGDWLLFLGADDILLDCLDVVACSMIDPEAIYYGDVELMSSGQRYGGKFTRYRLMQQNICHQAIFYPRSVYKNNMYDETCGLFADYKYNIELFGEGFRFTYLPILVSRFCDSGATKSADPVFENIRIELIRKHFGRVYFLLKCVRTFAARIFKRDAPLLQPF